MTEEHEMKELKTVGIATVGIATTAVLVFLLFHEWTKPRNSDTIFPAGNTYLGKRNAQAENTEPSTNRKDPSTLFTITEQTPWREIRGNIYPYTFSAPETVKLTTFPSDPYDIYALSAEGIDPGSNVMIGVDDLSKDDKKKIYIDTPLKEYVEYWWTQFPSLKGVKITLPLTNSNGLTGFIVKYNTQNGVSPYDDVFYSVPNDPSLVIHMANQVLPKEVFEKIVDSVRWGEK